MPTENVIINSLQDLLNSLGDDHAVGTRWYRGQRDADWQLMPFLLRENVGPSESTLLSRFRQNALRLLETPTATDFDWMFLMQHYGVPTRLLDWSEAPLTALYFATFESDEDSKDGVLWELDPLELNHSSGIDKDHEPGFIPSFEDEELEGYSIASLRATPRTHLNPIATLATRNSARIQAQAGVFTIHHLIRRPVEDIVPDALIRKFLIPSAAKPGIRNQLKKLGITRFHLFPELESIGVAVREITQ